MVKSDLFNDESICIFTDSSFKRYKFIPIGTALGVTAPAYCVFKNDIMIEQGFEILHNSTSQQGELRALLLGIMASYKYRDYPHIRIFGDNQNAIFGVREWIFNWVRQSNNGGCVFGENGRINNQDYIMENIYAILSNNIFLEFYHVKGHVNIRKRSDVEISRKLFQRSNPFVGRIDDALVYQLAAGNNTVDQYSSAMLNLYFNDSNYDTRDLTPAISIGYKPIDMNQYIKLVNKGGERRE